MGARRIRAGGAAAALLSALALPACALDVTSPWASTRPVAPEDSLTARRVVGAAPGAEPLLPETGNVWPEAEPPRATLADPDAALRGIPDYRPQIPPAEPQRQPEPTRPPRRRGSSTPPEAALPPERDFRNPTPLAQPPLSPPPPPAYGRTVVLPDGRTGVTTGGTDRVQTFNLPGGGTGTVNPDGTATVIGPDERARVAPRAR